MKADVDSALTEAYKQFNIPSDQFVKKPDSAVSFCNTVRASLGSVDHTDSALLDRLISLRKMGRLPRLRR